MTLKSRHICCGCGGLCDSGEPCPMAYNCAICFKIRQQALDDAESESLENLESASEILSKVKIL